MRVLLVDDDHEQRLATRVLLEETGYRVLEASRGLHALDLIETRDLDLLITDLSMPGMDGVTLADQVAEKLYRRDLPLAIVLMSEDNDHPGLRERIVDGGMAFLPKPFSEPELSAEIDTAFARKERLLQLTEERVELLDEKASRQPAFADRIATPEPPRIVPPPSEPATPPTTAAAVPESRQITAGSRVARDGFAWRVPALTLAVAAVLVLAVSGTLRTLDSNPPPLPPPPSEMTVRSTVLDGLDPVGTIAAPPVSFRWQETEAADATYRVEVRGVDERLLWSGTSPTPDLVVPAELAEILHPAVTYTWTVEARDASGARLGWSPAIEFRISPGT